MSNLTDHRAPPLPSPSLHPDWLVPHSLEWYAQLGANSGKYAYNWNSTIREPSGETIFTDELARLIKSKNTLDVGCGHGEFTRSWASLAAEVVGLDVTDGFITQGESQEAPNVRFVVGNVRDGMPFPDAYFDFAYSRRGPTSWFHEAPRIVQPGGHILTLHPGDDHQHELPTLFPFLFTPAPQGTPILDTLHSRLNASGLANITIETLRTTEYLATPDDVLTIACFGQKETVLRDLRAACYDQLATLFQQHATKEGLPVTHSRYLVRAHVL